MPSDVIFNPEGGWRIIHRLRRVAPCDFCGNPHRFLCDYGPINGGKTCDKKLCGVCATHVGIADYCPEHAPVEREKLEKPTP